MMPFQISRAMVVVSVGTALVAAIIVFCLLSFSAAQHTLSEPIGGPFELVDQDGIRVTEKTFAGKPSVIFFGYTSCPDACPTALLNLSTWLKAIGPDADNLNVLFISIDPERDTLAHLKEYLSSFDSHIRGLTGTDEEIAVVAKKYHVLYYKAAPLKAGTYTMDHTTSIYLMDRTGKFVNSISLRTDNKLAIESLRQLAGS